MKGGERCEKEGEGHFSPTPPKTYLRDRGDFGKQVNTDNNFRLLHGV